MKPLHYAEQPPAPTLAAHVLAYWRFECHLPPGESLLHHVWPDGCVSLAMTARPGEPPVAFVIGPTLEAMRVPVLAGQRTWGVRCWPDTGAALLGVAAERLRGTTVPVSVLLGVAAAPLLDALLAARDADEPHALEAWLAARVASLAPRDEAVRHAVQRLVETRGARAIGDVATDVGLGIRQLQRRFRGAVGLTPKEFARVRRARSTIAAVLDGEVRWSQVAAEFGFADQAHLVHDLAEVTGLTPTALGQRLGAIDHGPVTP